MTWTGVLTTLVPILGQGTLGLSTAQLSLTLTVGYVAELLGLLGLSMVIDRVRRERAFLGGAVAVATGSLVVATTTDVGAFVAGQTLVRGGFSVWMVPAMLLAERAGTPIAPRYLALYRIVLDSGMIAGPLLLGGFAEVGGARAAVGSPVSGGAVALLRR